MNKGFFFSFLFARKEKIYTSSRDAWSENFVEEFSAGEKFCGFFVGKFCGKILWENFIRIFCGKIFCGKILWENFIRIFCGKIFSRGKFKWKLTQRIVYELESPSIYYSVLMIKERNIRARNITI